MRTADEFVIGSSGPTNTAREAIAAHELAAGIPCGAGSCTRPDEPAQILPEPPATSLTGGGSGLWEKTVHARYKGGTGSPSGRLARSRHLADRGICTALWTGVKSVRQALRAARPDREPAPSRFARRWTRRLDLARK